MEIITTNLVNLEIVGTSRDEVIHELAKSIHLENRLNDYDQYVQSVFDREDLSSTGIGFGIAIPHGKSDAVKETTVAFGRTKNPVDWQSLDGSPANIIFLIAVPEAKKGDEHLRILASLSRKLIHQDFRDSLLASDSTDEIVSLINGCLN